MDDEVTKEAVELIKIIRAELSDFFDHVIGRIDGIDGRLDKIAAVEEEFLLNFIAARPHIQ